MIEIKWLATSDLGSVSYRWMGAHIATTYVFFRLAGVVFQEVGSMSDHDDMI